MKIQMKLLSMICLALICILSAILIISSTNRKVTFLNTQKNDSLEFQNKWLTFTGVNKSLLITDVSEPAFQTLLDEQKRILAEITATITRINSDKHLQTLDNDLSGAYHNAGFIWDLARGNINRTKMLLDSNLMETIQQKGGYGSVIEIAERLKSLGATREHLKTMELINSILALSSADESFHNSLDKLIDVINDQITAQERLSRKTLLLVVVITVFFATMSLLLIGSQIVKNIKTVEHAIRTIASGDFSIRLNIKTKDEFKTLSDNFNLFLRELGRNIESVREILKTFGSAITEKMQLPEILELIAERAFQDTNADGVAILLLDDAKEHLTLKALKGSFPQLHSILQSDEIGGGAPEDDFRKNHLNVEKSGFGRPILTGKPVFFKDIDRERRGKTKSIEEFPGICSIIMTPLMVERQPIGVMVLVKTKKDSPLTDLDYTHIKTFTDFAGLTIANFNSHQDMIANLNQEIEERKQAEEKLERFAQRLAIHVEQTPLGVIEWDLHFKVTQWNRAAENIFGYTCEEALGHHAADLVVPEAAREQVDRIWGDLVANKGGIRSTNQNFTKDGRELTCDWYNTTLVDSEGNVLGVASLVQDISEAKRLEEQLRQAQKMEAIGTLAGGIAHDFNNLLGVILGYADMAKDDIPEHSPAKNEIEEVLKAGNRAKDLVKQILSFSRKETQTRVPIEIHLIVKEALKFLRASIPTTIGIKEDIRIDCGYILADATQIHQVIINICTNAAQSMEESGGVLDVTLSCQELSESDLGNNPGVSPGFYTVLSIKDSGPGIDPAIIDRIFDPYFTTKDVGKGSGMGLSMVIGIVKSHDGMITVDSTPREGATFKVFFPTIEDEATEQEGISSAVPVGEEHILIVDDEASIANLTKKRVEKLGYQATAYTSSAETLEHFRLNPDVYDLVISDYTMPEMTGEQLAKELLCIRPNIPIIICTGYSAKMDAEKANSIGISAFILKPVDSQELARTLRQVLEAT